MPGKISFFQKGIKQTQPNSDIGILHALNIIRSGRYEEQIKQLRESSNKEVRQALKRDLGYFTFSGTFKKRNADSLIKHSGVICIDLDDLDKVDPEDPESPRYNDVNRIKYKLTFDPYILAMFVSPSGNGLKILVKINPEKHLESFKGLEQYFLQTHDLEIDQSGKDVSRACYVSWDPDVHINDGSKLFDAIIEGEFDIDFESGEIVEKSASIEDMDEKTRKSYDRADYVMKQIVDQGKDLTADYESWQLIGMSLSVFGEAGRELFHQVSQFHPEYKPNETDKKFDNFLKTSRFKSPAKFFAIAKENGLETRKLKKVNYGIAQGAGKAQDWQYITPDAIEATDELKEHTISYGFIEHKNRYFIAKFTQLHHRVDYDPISNYVVRPLFLIKSKSDPKRLYELKNMYGHKTVIDIPAPKMASIQSFCEIMESQGNFLLEASKKDFFKLKNKWFEMAKNAEEIKTLGWHRDGFYSFANGIFYDGKFHGIDEYGVVFKSYQNEEGEDRKRHYFIPAMSEIYKNEDMEYETEKNFIYVSRDIKWKDWAELFCQVHGDNGKAAMLYFISCIFRDIIYGRFKNFPHLFGFGPRGTGKSTLGWSLTYMYGKERKPFNLNSGTAPGFYRTFAQFNNATTWFDEFSNKIDLKRQEDLKNAYDGAGHVKGDWSSGGNSTKTISTPVKSGCYISGQELPISNPALFSRIILLEFTKSDFTQDQRDLAEKLLDMETPGLSKIAAGLTHFRDIVNEKFIETYDKVLRKLKKVFEDQEVVMIERLIHNNAILLSVYEILREHLEFPFSDKEIHKLVQQKLYKHSKLFSKSEETSQFWDIVQFLYNTNQINNTNDFVIKYVSAVNLRVDRKDTTKKVFESPKTLLFISLSKVHGLYQRTLRERGENRGMDKESLIHYLEHSQGYIGAVNSVNYGDRKSSGFVFDYDVIKNMNINLQKEIGGSDDVDEAGEGYKAPDEANGSGKGEDEDLPF